MQAVDRGTSRFMSLQQYHYLIPQGLKPEGIAEFLQSHGMHIRPPRAHSGRQEFYDSFDWRLYEASYCSVIARAIG